MSIAITLTTIHEPRVIGDLLENVGNHGHRDVGIIVVGDRKTPDGVGGYCEGMARRYGVGVQYLDVSAQADYLKRFPALERHLPYNSFSRRNLADLLAWEEGADLIIRIDDDNFPTGDDFVGKHRLIGGERQLNVVTAGTGWFNVCETLTEAHGVAFYPRGFPYSRRWQPDTVSVTTRSVRVGLNAGLWVGDPDVDAITRLCRPVNVREYRAECYGEQFALAAGTWCPINTQNTAYAARLLPAAFVPPRVGRYDDIWSGYLLRKLMDHMGDYVTYGAPILRQLRNAHDLWGDLAMELNGNVHTEHLLQALAEISLKRATYGELYVELADQLDGALTENREVFADVIAGMRIWAESIGLVPRRV